MTQPTRFTYWYPGPQLALGGILAFATVFMGFGLHVYSVMGERAGSIPHIRFPMVFLVVATAPWWLSTAVAFRQAWAFRRATERPSMLRRWAAFLTLSASFIVVVSVTRLVRSL